ncbi:uncharacterized protein P884DRAFT_213794 [Thermothelomyces heterothallicus CBS 202.75]|uniref:uncharacterized protein n=1 Tax=Thermothelomyces heterothallicus CBS 202.75 TaxID=1149848 RepID=UPI0037423464
MWKSYRYPIQKIDALRYVVLYHYGVILDMDLEGKRGLGPLRRFEFVARAAYPTGFSMDFIMASRGNAYVGELVNNLKRYNRHWLGLPYPTVMFSTGLPLATLRTTIHSLQTDREDLKILAGTRENPKMHSPHGDVSTPTFNHLGSSSWCSYDAAMIVRLGKDVGAMFPCLALLRSVICRTKRRRVALR